MPHQNPQTPRQGPNSPSPGTGRGGRGVRVGRRSRGVRAESRVPDAVIDALAELLAFLRGERGIA